MTIRRFLLALPVLIALALTAADAPPSLTQLRLSFAAPPADVRPMVRWWWFGPAVVKPELEKEIFQMKADGFGGFEVQPVYPLTLDDPAHNLVNLPYLSDGFLDALRFAAQIGRREHMRFDLTLCSGWPYGGPNISIAQASGRLRVARTQPQLAEGESLVASFPDLFFIASHTRQQVKRPAVGAEGFVLDHYSRAALDTHLTHVADRLLAALGADKPYAVFSDSLEVYNADWTTDFLKEFRARRGYDLTPYLPALAGDIGEKTLAIRHDWGKTLTELAEDNYLKPLTAWSHQHGTLFRSQTYGVPPVRLSSNALVDLPEGEGAQWRQFSATRWAASASHLYGRPVTSSETFTWLHSPVFRASPLDMKAEADIHFLNGINQFVCHGWPYSPPQAGEPGWRFYAAAVFNHHNPWSLVMPDITLYIQRVSYLLRQGKPVNDVAIYLPTDDAWAGFTLGRNPSINQSMDRLLGPNVIPQVLSAGYNFDFIDDGAIEKVGVPYKILILPGVERIPLSTLRKITDWAHHGGTVIATRRVPSLAPGLQEAATDTPQIRELAKSLSLTDESKLADALHAALTPDVAAAPEIGVVHRQLPGADIYFLANTSNHPVETEAVFRIQGTNAAWWDPLNAKITAAPAGNRIPLALAPYESRVLVFSKESLPPAPVPSSAAPAPIDLSTGWSLTFPSTAPLHPDALPSWTDLDGRKFYSGQAVYQRSVTVPPAMIASGHPIFLTMGEGTASTGGPRAANGLRALLDPPVRESAVVYVNGRRVAAVWCAPYEVNVTTFVHAGENQLRIVAANLALNEMAGAPLPDYKELNAKYGERFQPQDMAAVQPIPSGLLGPIRLVSR